MGVKNGELHELYDWHQGEKEGPSFPQRLLSYLVPLLHTGMMMPVIGPTAVVAVAGMKHCSGLGRERGG